MKIYIKHTKKAETAPKFTTHLKDCESGYAHPIGEYCIVNYGRINSRGHVNRRIVCNKLTQLILLSQKGIKTPEIYPYNPKGLLTRQIIPKYIFPLLARRIKHSQGKDIIYLRNREIFWKRLRRIRKRDFFIKYIPKKAEFRVHILGNEAVSICQKVPSDKYTSYHPHIWCSLQGWTLIDYNGEYSTKLKEIGLAAVNALNYDFGAVDIGLGKDSCFYVFEVNSAPRLSRTRLRLYAKFFRQKERELASG